MNMKCENKLVLAYIELAIVIEIRNFINILDSKRDINPIYSLFRTISKHFGLFLRDFLTILMQIPPFYLNMSTRS